MAIPRGHAYAEECNNYYTLIDAMKYTKEGLEGIVKRSVEDLYERIYNKCHGIQPCVDNCTAIHGSKFKKWCDSCTKWREELSLFMNYSGHVNRVEWKLFDSRDWLKCNDSSTINQVANIFVYKCKQPKKSITDDFIDMISLFENCSYFAFGKNKGLTRDIRSIRNDFFAHNSSYTINNKDTLYCLDKFSTLLNQPLFRTDKKCNEMHKLVCDLKNSRQRVQNNNTSETKSIMQPFLRLYHNEPMIVVEKANEVISNIKNKQLTRPLHRRYDLILLVLLLYYHYIEMPWNTNNGFKPPKGCNTMDFTFPWKSDLNFKSYISVREDFVGREWMTEDIAYELLHTDRRGLLIAAELGFGKSALVSHIACSHDQISSAYPIYEKTIGIHMCRYDTNLTLSPGIFVRNMAGKLAEQFPEFGNILNTENMASDYLTNSKCIQDPHGCFDHTILYPLQNLNSSQDIIFIVDALDECIEIGPRNIFSLLNKKIHLLPQNIKFLFTSRNISTIRVNLPPGVSVYQTHLFREKSLGDIKKYISHRLENNSVNEQYQTLLSSSNLDETLEKLADLVDGNFLFLTNAFDFWVRVGNINAFPDKMEHIYRLNVLRIFDKSENIFEDVRSIIEILCASQGLIKESLLYEILNVYDFKRRKYFSRLLSNELSHFIQRASENVVFTNKRIADFFSRQDNLENDFYIFQQNGHKLIAKFFLKHLENQHANISVTLLKDTFRHVALSEDKTLKNRLINEISSHTNESKYSFLMHYIAASLNSYDAMSIAILSMSHSNIDMKDPGKSTASFIAATYGNDNALAALIERGSDVNYQRPPPVFIQLKHFQDPIHFCKYNIFCGYNLANIASQNGHANVLKFLIKYNINLCHETSLGLNSFHLASEHDHVHILRILMSSKLCNWTSSFDQALYLSAKNGHVRVVKYLLSINATDNCVPCSNFIHWIPKGKSRLQTYTRMPNLPYERDYKNYLLRDDRRFYFCESALDIAVQNNHLEVFKILVGQKENALNCVSARGMTPAITAVVFNSKDVIYHFLQSGLPLNDTCTVRHIKKRFKNYDEDMDNETFCKNDLSFWHMLAIHSSPEIFTNVSNNAKYDYVWKLTDNNGATPFHHACCNRRVEYGSFFMLASHILDRTLNGSTPAHSAAVCLNVIPIYIFMKYKNLPIDIKDYSYKNILHYFATSTQNTMSISIDFLSKFINESYDKLISEQDSDGRTPLHFAAMSGNTLLIKNDYWNITFQPDHYMIRDKFNSSVLDILFEYMPSFQPILGKFTLKLPYGCDFDDLLRTPGCAKIRLKILDNFEMFAFKALSDLKGTNLLRKRNIFSFMNEALKKNRFYVLHMIKVFFPKLYQSVSKSNVHLFFGQLFQKSIYPNLILSSTVLPDLMKYACESRKQYGYLWYMFYDSQRKFWPMYTIWNGTQLYNVMDLVLRKCTQRDLWKAAVKGGNLYPLLNTGIRKLADYNITNFVHLAPCIIPQSKYLAPNLKLIANTNSYLSMPDVTPFSHPVALQFILHSGLKIQYSTHCLQNTPDLSIYHIWVSKGFWSLYEFSEDKELLKCKNRYKITPAHLAYFFNHSSPYQENIDTKRFIDNHFSALFFKVVMDFRTFVFPEHSKAWTCVQYVHKFNRMSLKKLLFLGSLENEICSLISKLYQVDWDLVFHIFSFKNIQKFVDLKQPFEFINYIQHIRTTCQYKKDISPSQHVSKFYKANKIVNSECLNPVDFLKSRFCLKYITFLNKQRKHVNYKIESILVMYFPLCYLIYHRFIIELPDLAQKNTMEIIQIMNAYGSTPFFHNNPKYNYWNKLRSPFTNPFRTMTQTILSSDVAHILSWIRFPALEIEQDEFHSEKEKHAFVSYNYPLSMYENLTKNLT
ncbi:uncharacterized protein LOC128157746 isoform X1 [Crassostrea angulata]|uniref:uncharacterized protein LOC128157746 isoform X1 n=2 Tax=Magallana angulata TaxID=2784310 RepID=UPI0022B09C40|nr:uncharacterized protein LOC128157746 isoform X1 [Crassostrea angulata]